VWSLGVGNARHAGHVSRGNVTVVAQVTHDSQVVAMSLWWCGRRMTRRSRQSRRCCPGGAGNARRAGRVDVIVVARTMHDTQVPVMSSWQLLRGSSTRSSCPPRCARVWSLGTGNARHADHHDVIVAAAPWELRVFFVPAVMFLCLVARHG
jgi:hypothetical protein